jgi:hypothetical protein
MGFQNPNKQTTRLNVAMKFTLSRLLPLVVGSAAAGVLASMSPAKAVVLTIGGTAYDVTTITGTYNANKAAIEGTPWWGDGNKAKVFTEEARKPVVLFAYVNYTNWQVYPSVGLVESKVWQGTNNFLCQGTNGVYCFVNKDDATYTYAIAVLATPVPVPFDFDGGTIPAVVGAFVLAARWKARRSISSKTRTANPDVAVP